MHTPDTSERRGALSAGGFITGSDSGAAIGRCKPVLLLRQGWKPAGQRQLADSVHDSPNPQGGAQPWHFLPDTPHSRKKQKSHTMKRMKTN